MIKEIYLLENGNTWKYLVRFITSSEQDCNNCILASICNKDSCYSYYDKGIKKISAAKGHLCYFVQSEVGGKTVIANKIISKEKVIPKDISSYKVAIERNSVISVNEIFQKFCKNFCFVKNNDLSCRNSIECPFSGTSFSENLKVFVINEE